MNHHNCSIWILTRAVEGLWNLLAVEGGRILPPYLSRESMIQLEWNTCQMKGLYETLLKHPLILSIKVKGQVKHRSRSGQNGKSWKLGCLMWLLPFSAYSDVITRTKTLCGIFLTILEKCGQFDWSVAINDRYQYRTQASSCFSCCVGRAVPSLGTSDFAGL